MQLVWVLDNLPLCLVSCVLPLLLDTLQQFCSLIIARVTRVPKNGNRMSIIRFAKDGLRPCIKKKFHAFQIGRISFDEAWFVVTVHLEILKVGTGSDG